MKQSVPRNELEAILMAAEASLVVRNALTDKVGEVFYFTDSQIALCWVLNMRKKLRMWVHNRVKDIQNVIRWVVGGVATYPLYYIEGSHNLADLVTKPKELCREDIDATSAWQTGLPWMYQPSNKLPMEQLAHPLKDDEQEVFEQEVFPEGYLLQESEERQVLLSQNSVPSTTLAQVYALARSPLEAEWLTSQVDFVKQGWTRALKIVSLICGFVEKLKHLVHIRNKANREGCSYCMTDPSIGLARLSLRQVLKAASRQAEAAEGAKGLAKHYTFQDGLWYSSGRLGKEGCVDAVDLDSMPFFDSITLQKLVPIVLTRSTIFQSYMAYIHDRLMDHPGVEPTLREVKLTMMPIGAPGPRIVILNHKKKCTKCRLRLKQTIEKELADFPACRTTVAPPFYFVQMDIAMGFRGKRYDTAKRSEFSVHALVIVCLTTSATNILVLDGLRTESVVMALQRHAARYGMPGEIYVDSGTNLVKLADVSFDLRGVDGAMFRGSTFRITVSTPKAHEKQGRVERRIRVLREMLERVSQTSSLCETLIGWETLFARISSQIDDLPIARGSATAATDIGWEIITPNRLKLGRNNHRNLDGDVVLDNAPQTLLDRNRAIFAVWYKIFLERLHLLVPRAGVADSRELRLDDIVLFRFQDSSLPRLEVWKLGRVVQLISARTVLIQYSHAGAGHLQIRRSVRQICLILGIEEYGTTDEKGITSPESDAGQPATQSRYELRSRQAPD